jgi:hypothetical protein
MRIMFDFLRMQYAENFLYFTIERFITLDSLLYLTFDTVAHLFHKHKII